MTISFFQRGETINARLTDGSLVSLRLTTGLKVPPYAKFVKDKFVGNTPDILNLNNDLLRLKLQISEIYEKHKTARKVKELFVPKVKMDPPLDDDSNDVVNLCRLYLKKARSSEIKSKSQRPLTDNTIRLYSFAVANLEEYTIVSGSIDLLELSVEASYDTLTKRRITSRFINFFKGLDNYMLGKKYTLKSRSTVMNLISIMVSYWEREMFLRLPKINYEIAPDNQVVVLDPKFVSKFLTDDLYNQLDQDMKCVWEVCATILITTMRLDDALKLNVDDLHITPSTMFLSKVNGKTKAVTDVPLPGFLEKIYRDNLLRYGTVYSTKPDSSLIYARIRDLFGLYEELHMTTSVRKVGIDGNYEVKTAPFYEHIHPHMLRKTAITTMIYNGVSERHIKFLSGHSLKSAAFEKYVAFVERKFTAEVTSYYDKILTP